MKFVTIYILLALTFILSSFIPAFSNGPGNLDLTFAGKGYKYDGFPGGSDVGTATAVQPDGKIIVAGHTSKQGSNRNIALARFNPDGTFDTTFNGTGKVITTVLASAADNPAEPYAIALQTDGKIVVAGWIQMGSSNFDFLLLRYNANGTLDTTFDGDGKVITALSSGNDQACGVAIQADGKIVITGVSSNVSAVVRYNPNGSLDTSFDGDGIVTTPVRTTLGIAIQTDGKIITAGGDAANHFTLVRYNPSGSLDTSFDGDGIATTAILDHDYAYSVAIQPDGKIVAAGDAVSGSQAMVAVVRYNTDGSLDTSFDGDGKVTTPAAAGLGGVSRAMALQADGKIVATGFSDNNNTDSDFLIVRYNTNGSLDTSYGGTGIVMTSLSAGQDWANASALQADGKVIVAGVIRSGAYDFAVARYNTNGSLDTSFDGDGKLAADIGYGLAWARDALVQPDGKTIVVGLYFSFICMTRYNQDGSVDPTFGTNGQLWSSFAPTFVDSPPSDVLLQPDGKILVVGANGWDINRRVGVARFNSDGSMDTSFDGDGKLVINLAGLGSAYANSVALQPDGKIVITAYGLVNLQTGQYRFAIIRCNADGSPDTTFDGDGQMFPTNINGGPIAVQPDGKIVVGGWVTSSFAIARYNSNGTPDTSFDGDGLATTSMGAGSVSSISAITILADGRILAGGNSTTSSNTDFAMARYNADGSPDTSFDSDGKVVTPVLAGNDTLAEFAIQTDGKIVAAGTTNNGTNSDFAAVRYNTDGSLDTTYGSGGKAVVDLGFEESTSGLAIDNAGNAVLVGTSYDFITVRLTGSFAPGADVSGRLLSTTGMPIGGAYVTISNTNGFTQTARTSSFGYYTFFGISSNESYTVSVSSKRYRFQPPSRVITVMGSITDVDFIGNPGSESRPAETVPIATEKNPAELEKSGITLNLKRQ